MTRPDPIAAVPRRRLPLVLVLLAGLLPAASASAEWVQTQKLTATDPAERDQFGCSVAIDGGRVLVGASYNDDAGQNPARSTCSTPPPAGATIVLNSCLLNNFSGN